MAVRRTNGNFPGGGTVTLQGLPGRLAIAFQNQSQAAVASVTYASGFAVLNIPPNGLHERSQKTGSLESLQGAITLGGTAGEPYDVEETYT